MTGKSADAASTCIILRNSTKCLFDFITQRVRLSLSQLLKTLFLLSNKNEMENCQII